MQDDLIERLESKRGQPFSQPLKRSAASERSKTSVSRFQSIERVVHVKPN